MSNKISPTELTGRLTDSLNDLAFVDAWFYHLIDKLLAKTCESPIEALLGAALLFYDKFEGWPGRPLDVAGQDEIPHWDEGARLLIPQYKLGDYRIDWAYRDGREGFTFIECDGHEFHERTKEQAARDRSRDRDIISAGHILLRFTGSEIWNAPFACAKQISCVVEDRNLPPELRRHIA